MISSDHQRQSQSIVKGPWNIEEKYCQPSWFMVSRQENKILESNLNSNQMSEEYNDRKAKPEEIYDNISEGAKVRIQILCYEEVEKSSKYLLHL